MPNRKTAQVTSTRHTVATKLHFFSAQPRPVAPHNTVAKRVRDWIAPCLSIMLFSPALAADSSSSFGDEAMAALQEESRAAAPLSAYEVNSLVLPTLGDPGWGSTAQRPGSAASFANATQHIDVTRWLTPDEPRSLGFSLGLTSTAPSASALANAGNPNGPAAPTSLDLGVRWRSRLDSGRHLDVSAWAQTPQWAQSPDAMGLIWQQQQPVYGTRVEVQWASSKTRGLVPEFGAIGVQLQGNSRLLLRARKGGPMLYYRAKF